jgi:hypothetical protein
MCIAMHGSVHPTNTMIGTHPNCRCSMAPLPRRTANPVTPGAEQFATWDTGRQMATLGPAKYAAYRAGALDLRDLVGEARHPVWGLTRHERSLRSVLGERASSFYRAA